MSNRKFDLRNRYKRHRRVRRKIFGMIERPRLNVFRSSRHIYAQLINDELGETMASASSLKFVELLRFLFKAEKDFPKFSVVTKALSEEIDNLLKDF